MVVGENNLAVQMSALRRALSEHANGEPLIVNLPGRGYQFVADVTMPSQAPAVAEPPAPAAAIQETPPPPPGHIRWTGWIAGGLAVLIMALLVLIIDPDAWHGLVSEAAGSLFPSTPEARLSIAVPRFAAIDDDRRTAALAIHYTDAVLARFGQFEDLVLYSDPETAQSRFTPAFPPDRHGRDHRLQRHTDDRPDGDAQRTPSLP